MEMTRRLVLGGIAATGLAATRAVAGQQSSVPPIPEPNRGEEYRDMRARLLAAFPYERITVPGARVQAEWERLKAEGRGWPVAIGADADLERLADQFAMAGPAVTGAAVAGLDARSVDQIIAASHSICFPEDLRRWPGAYQPEDLRAPVGRWPTKVGMGNLGPSVAFDPVSSRPYDKVHIVMLPTRNGWEAPAYLRWGDWNACPPPEYHVAALRDWHDRFGADLVGINGDTMDLKVRNRPGSRDRALALAHDMYGYCPDIVDQGVGTISALAAQLMASDWWYLWWD